MTAAQSQPRVYPVPATIPPGAVADPTSPSGIRVVDQAAYSAWHRGSLAAPGNEANYEQRLASNALDPVPKPETPTLEDLEEALSEPPAPPTLEQRLAAAPGAGSQGFTPIGAPRRELTASQPSPQQLGTFDLPAPGVPGGPTPEEMGAPEVDRARIDALLGNVSKANTGLMGLATLEDQYSAAQAQLAQGLDQSQRQSLALARSGNRRDAAAMQARALQTGAELAAQATQSSALLRAQEEDAAQRLKLDAFKAAGDLGLNAAALEVDVNNLNMTAATSFLNQLFETSRLGMQLDEQEAARITGFIRDMALISKDYYALDLSERQSIRDDLTRRYGIRENAASALDQIEKQREFRWEDLARDLLVGAGSGASAAGFKALFASDERLKENVSDTTDEELEELLSVVKSKTYDYKGARSKQGRQFGLMAQDLQKSRLGRGMVEKTSDGTLLVDGGKAGAAALSALSMIHERLKALEAAL